MKKSRIILPAVALLTISTVAAASSTVAWFAASRDVTVTGNTVTVVNPESALNVTLAPLKGTTETTKDQTLNLPLYMRDGSVNIDDNGQAYKQDIVTKEYVAANYTTENDSQGNPIYRAASWKMTFKMVADSADNYAVFFNTKDLATKIKATVDAGNTNEKIKESFRIAFVAGNVKSVLAPFAETDNELTYVKAAGVENADSALGKYNTIRISNIATRQPTEIASGDAQTNALTAANGYIGTITTGNELEVTCYAWFEGMDPSCVVDNGISTKVTTVLDFYASRLLNA